MSEAIGLGLAVVAIIMLVAVVTAAVAIERANTALDAAEDMNYRLRELETRGNEPMRT